MTAKLPWSSDPGTTFESEVFLENVELLNQDVIKLVKEINIYKSSGLPNINSRLLKDGFMALIDFFFFNFFIYPGSYNSTAGRFSLYTSKQLFLPTIYQHQC